MSRRPSTQARSIPFVLLLAAVLIGWSLPAIGVLVDSLRPTSFGVESGWWTMLTDPAFTLDHYRQVLDGGGPAGGLWSGFLGSLAIALPSTVVPVLLGSAAAYAFAWIPFRGRSVLFMVVVGLAIVPLQMALIPLVAAYTDLGLIGEWSGLWLAHSAVGLPLAILLMRNAIAQVPEPLVDAAASDGAGHVDTFWRVVLPLTIPALVAVAALQFLLVWNDFLLATTLLGEPAPGTSPLTVGLAELVLARGQDQHLLSAGTMVTVAVPLVVFFSLQHVLVSATRAAAFDT